MNKFFRWYGGKIRMLEKLEALIPEHQIYMEPFIGSGALALNHIRSPVEIINDLDGDIANLFRVMSDREKGKELIERLSHVAYDRKVFDAVRGERKNNFKGYNSVDKAVLTYIMISQSFNAAEIHSAREAMQALNYITRTCLTICQRSMSVWNTLRFSM